MMTRTDPGAAQPINEALRSHVTATTFVLTLGSTHIAALAHVVHELARNRSINEDSAAGTLDQRASRASRNDAAPRPLRRAFAHSATGMNGLIARGLIEYHHCETRVDQMRASEYWSITPAGHHVIGLLTEAGIWQEYGAVLPALPEPKPSRRGRSAAA